LGIELILLLTALLAVVAVGFLFARSPSGAAWGLVLAFVATQALVTPLKLEASVMGYSLYVLDPITAIMLVVGVLGLLQGDHPRSLSIPLMTLSALLVLHVVWGMTTVGMQTAVTAARPWLYVVGPLVYASQATPPWTRVSFRPLIFGAAALSAYLMFWIAQNGFRGANMEVGDGSQSRALTGVGALLILFCLLIAVSARFTRSPGSWWLVALMGTGVVLAQYRTVWLIAVISIAVAYIGWARLAIFANERAALSAASVVLLATPVAVALAASSSALGYSARTSVGADTTLTWRFESWRGALEAHHSAQDLLLGVPAGISYARRIGGQIATVSVHSFYLDALLFFGALGLAILVYLGIRIIKLRYEASAALGVSPATVVLIVTATAIFGITTMLGAVQGLLLGMLLQGAFLGRQRGLARESGRVPRLQGWPGEL